jgi:hypothetical protein
MIPKALANDIETVGIHGSEFCIDSVVSPRPRLFIWVYLHCKSFEPAHASHALIL